MERCGEGARAGVRASLSFGILAGAALLGGCANTLTAKVTSFHTWDAGGSRLPLNYVFFRSPSQDNNLEFQTYENIVADGLFRRGFTQTAEDKANYRVNFGYSLSEKVVRVMEPVFYGPPYAGPYWGPVYYGRHPYPRPFYVPPPYPAGYVERGYPVANYSFSLDIQDIKSGKRVYQVTVEGRDQSPTPSLPNVMQALVEAALNDFPGVSGQSRTIRITLPNTR